MEHYDFNKARDEIHSIPLTFPQYMAKRHIAMGGKHVEIEKHAEHHRDLRWSPLFTQLLQKLNVFVQKYTVMVWSQQLDRMSTCSMTKLQCRILSFEVNPNNNQSAISVMVEVPRPNGLTPGVRMKLTTFAQLFLQYCGQENVRVFDDAMCTISYSSDTSLNPFYSKTVPFNAWLPEVLWFPTHVTLLHEYVCYVNLALGDPLLLCIFSSMEFRQKFQYGAEEKKEREEKDREEKDREEKDHHEVPERTEIPLTTVEKKDVAVQTETLSEMKRRIFPFLFFVPKHPLCFQEFKGFKNRRGVKRKRMFIYSDRVLRYRVRRCLRGRYKRTKLMLK
jgi:hypothetical protein